MGLVSFDDSVVSQCQLCLEFDASCRPAMMLRCLIQLGYSGTTVPRSEQYPPSVRAVRNSVPTVNQSAAQAAARAGAARDHGWLVAGQSGRLAQAATTGRVSNMERQPRGISAGRLLRL